MDDITVLFQADAIEKLKSDIVSACQPDKAPMDPETKAKIARGKVKANEQRLRAKRYRSMTLKNRKNKSVFDD